MFNYKINFLKVIKENLPLMLHTPRRLNRLRAAAKPFKEIYKNFKAAKDDALYKCTFNGSVIYLECALNDRFDKVNRGITISDAFYKPVYIYRKSELKPAMIVYRRWNNIHFFAVGKFCFYQGHIYEATTAHTNKIPGIDPEWTLRPDKKAPVLRRKANFTGEIKFYVNVPSTVVFNVNEMKALVNYYRFASLKFLIRIV